MANVCVVPGCRSSYKPSKCGINPTFFNLPFHNSSLLNIWYQNMRIDPNKVKSYSRICHRHFEAKYQIIKCEGSVLNSKFHQKKRRRLQRGAIPTILNVSPSIIKKRLEKDKIKSSKIMKIVKQELTKKPLTALETKPLSIKLNRLPLNLDMIHNSFCSFTISDSKDSINQISLEANALSDINSKPISSAIQNDLNTQTKNDHLDEKESIKNIGSLSSKSNEEETKQKETHELRKLDLGGHSTFFTNWDPLKSQRETRKIMHKVKGRGKKRMHLHNEYGVHIKSGLDLCDCLEEDCPGCHFPCPKCASTKCGIKCRSNRRWIVEEVVVEGFNKSYTHPALKPKCT